jgi:NAD(P)-dependent dehydrogenase (short-subunit alcohol dehydrogenase family)
MRLANKNAIVTGAAHGIGRAIAEVFAREGAEVWIIDLDAAAGAEAADAITAAGGQAWFFQCDVSRAEQVKSAVLRATSNAGRMDILCNNAAFLSGNWHGSIDAPSDEWERSFQVSLMGAQHFCREVLPFMMKQGRGSIINISSVQGLVAGRHSAAYTTIKHALLGLTRSVACDYGANNIRCNAICPGAITTRISPPAGSELLERQIGKTFLGRVGEPVEVANAALFLASDESSYVTGAVLTVDGGWTAM